MKTMEFQLSFLIYFSIKIKIWIKVKIIKNKIIALFPFGIHPIKALKLKAKAYQKSLISKGIFLMFFYFFLFKK